MKTLVCLALISSVAPLAEAAAFSGYYEIVNINSGMVLEVPGGSTQNGTVLDQCTGYARANQQWSIISLGGNYYKIINRGSGLAIEVGGWHMNNGATVDQWTDNAGANQHWSITSQGGKYYSIINQNSGLALEVGAKAVNNGAGVNQWAFNNGYNQQWLILQVGAKTTVTPASGGSGEAANTFHGFNWADPSDNYVDRALMPSGMTITDTYSDVQAKAEVVLGTFSDVGANTVRVPINPPTVIGPWWTNYMGGIDEASALGMKVIIANWEAYTSRDGLVDDLTLFWQMWDTVVTKYNGNPDVYFEIFNEPHGYSSADWLSVVSDWLKRYPTVARGRVLVGGTSYCQNIPAVASSSITSGCLYSAHDYGFFNSSQTTSSYWYGNLSSEVGSYARSTVLTEFGGSMTSGWNYAGGDQNNNEIASVIGFSNYAHDNNMGSIYWPGLRDWDNYSMFTRDADTTVLTLNSPSGLARIKHAWGGYIGSGTYRIINGNSGLAMEVKAASTTNGGSVDQWPWLGRANQQWVITDLGNGYYSIINHNSGLALDVPGGSTQNGTVLDQWTYHTGANQQWSIISLGGNYYKIINRGSGLAIEVGGWHMNNGATVDQWDFNNGANQEWTFAQ